MEAQEEEEENSGTTAESSPNKSGNWQESDSCLQWIVGTKKKQEAEKQVEDRRQNGENVEDDEDAEEKFTKGLFEFYFILIIFSAAKNIFQFHKNSLVFHLPNC